MSPTEFLDRKFASDKTRRCWMCGCLLTRGTATVDHLKPKAKGGRDAAENYSLACKPCNNSRGDKSIPLTLLEQLKGRPAPKRRNLSALSAAIKRRRACTCHPNDNPPSPCAERYALSDCKEARNGE